MHRQWFLTDQIGAGRVVAALAVGLWLTIAAGPTIAQPAQTTEPGVFTGSYFDIQAPAGFVARPTRPAHRTSYAVVVQTDEAWFTAPDGSAEFYVFSPLWSGSPAYLEAQAGEVLASESSNRPADWEYDPSGYGINVQETITRIIRDRRNRYERVIIVTTTRPGSDDETMAAFGFQYANDRAYARYADAFAEFRDSLLQYAD